MSKRAFITGITGQDGSYLTELLLEKGYEVAGLVRRVSSPNYTHLTGVLDSLKLYDGDLTDQGSIDRAIKDFKPSEVYNLAAQSFVKSSWNSPSLTAEVTGLGALRVLESILNHNPNAKYYQASSSEMYGNNGIEFLNEESRMLPTSPYAIAKLYAHLISKNYRDSYGMYTASGILFNHESPRRGIEFVTRKITYAVACIKHGVKFSKMSGENKEPLVMNGKFKLGNVEATRDWGYAKDYVEMMWLMLQQDVPDDYVVATGVSYSIKDFLSMAFDYVGIEDWSSYVEISEGLKRPSELVHLRGDSSKASKELGWSSKTDLKSLVKLMIDSDMKLVERYEEK